MSDGTMLSRSGRSSPDGKLERRIDVPMSEELEAAVIALATIDGMSKAEWVRGKLERIVHGDLVMLRRMTRTPGARQSEEYGSNAP